MKMTLLLCLALVFGSTLIFPVALWQTRFNSVKFC